MTMVAQQNCLLPFSNATVTVALSYRQSTTLPDKHLRKAHLGAPLAPRKGRP